MFNPTRRQKKLIVIQGSKMRIKRSSVSRPRIVFLMGFTMFTSCMTLMLMSYVTLPMTKYYSVSRMDVYNVLSLSEDETVNTRTFVENGLNFQKFYISDINSTNYFPNGSHFGTLSEMKSRKTEHDRVKKTSMHLQLFINDTAKLISNDRSNKLIPVNEILTLNKTGKGLPINETIKLVSVNKAANPISLNETSKLEAVKKTGKTVPVNETIALVNETANSRSVNEKKTFVQAKVTNEQSISPMSIFNSIKTKWKFNAKEAKKLRVILEKDCKTKEMFTVTQKNVELNGTIKFDADRRSQLSVTQEVYKRFPEEMPFKKSSFKKCSLVGNSGILLGSQCGKSIDSSDFVIRFNLARLRNYSKDTGTKTNLITCNPSILTANYSSVEETGSAANFTNYVKQEYGNTTVYSAAFSYRRYAEPAFRAQDALEDANIKSYYTHANYITLVKRFFNRRKKIKEARISSGLLLLAGAFSFCQEIHLYGYWPFSTDPQEKPLNHHYYDKYAWMSKKHDMPVEFQMLIDWHNKGILRLHVGKCQ
ncbi:alpha-2,8-sialyltransferase 8E-like [Ptychodera flava]|uniref:alpha-2,8-sialyltransferase 8E-like n=1 Tax=Ptychodera flava TaxID=63121 RepID=UPI00396A1424